jgi:hypothetical protein
MTILFEAFELLSFLASMSPRLRTPCRGLVLVSKSIMPAVTTETFSRQNCCFLGHPVEYGNIQCWTAS